MTGEGDPDLMRHHKNWSEHSPYPVINSKNICHGQVCQQHQANNLVHHIKGSFSNPSTKIHNVSARFLL